MTPEVDLIIIGGSQWNHCFGSWPGQDGCSQGSGLPRLQSSAPVEQANLLEERWERLNEVAAFRLRSSKLCPQ